MDVAEAKCYLGLIALCCGPTQEDADFLRSLGQLLQVPIREQASSITMLTEISKSENPLQMAENLALNIRGQLLGNQETTTTTTAIEHYCMLFLLCFQPVPATSATTRKDLSKKELGQIYQHVQFNAHTSVIFRRLAFLLRIKLSTVSALEEAAIEHWKRLEQQVPTGSQTADSSSSSGGTNKPIPSTTTNKEQQRRKGIIRGLKIGAAATGAGVLLGVTGGLAAPALAAGLAHIGLGAAAAVTTTASMAAFMGAGGAGLAGYKMNRRTQGVKYFEFQRINTTFEDDDDDDNDNENDDKDDNNNEEDKKKIKKKKKEEHNGMTVYICVSGYLRRPGPVSPEDLESFSENDEKIDTSIRGSSKVGRRRRFSFRRGNSNDSNSSSNDPRKQSPLKRGGSSSQGATSASSSSSSSALIVHSKSSAANSPEFHEPWGAQPPLLFPEQVLDRYYATVAPEKRAIVPMLLNKYRKQFKEEERKKNSNATAAANAQEGGSVGMGGEDQFDIFYSENNILSFMNDDSEETTTFVGSAEEKLYSCLEKEYGIHPLQLIEAAATSIHEQQQELDQSTTELYRTLLLKGQARLEALLTNNKKKKNVPDTLSKLMLTNEQIAPLLCSNIPWDGEFVPQDSNTTSTKTEGGGGTESAVGSNNNDEAQDDVLIQLDEGVAADDDQVLQMISDLNTKFEEMDHVNDNNTNSQSTAATADNSTTSSSQQTTQEAMLQEELDRLAFDPFESNNDQGDDKRGNSNHSRLNKRQQRSKQQQQQQQSSDIYWWKESVARYGDQFTLVWEPKTLLECGCCVENLIKESASKGAISALRFTALAPIMMTVALPVVIMGVVTVLDNYWSMATAAADEAGKLLADALLSGAHGNRPVTLVGYSVGGRVVASCLKALSKVATNSNEGDNEETTEEITTSTNSEGTVGGGGGNEGKRNSQGNKKDMNEKLRQYKESMLSTRERKRRAQTIVRDAVIIGAPLDRSLRNWTRRRSVVQGRLINVYNPKDWVLALLYRYKSWSVVSLAGLQPVEASPVDGLPRIENYNVSDIVGGHGEYHAKIRDILNLVGVGDLNCDHAHSHYFASGSVAEKK